MNFINLLIEWQPSKYGQKPVKCNAVYIELIYTQAKAAAEPDSIFVNLCKWN